MPLKLCIPGSFFLPQCAADLESCTVTHHNGVMRYYGTSLLAVVTAYTVYRLYSTLGAFTMTIYKSTSRKRQRDWQTADTNTAAHANFIANLLY